MLLSDTLPEKCVWLDGSVKSRSTYSKLFNVYGTTYGSGYGDGLTFNVPDFRNRVAWGSQSVSSPYIEAGIPNFSGYITSWGGTLGGHGDITQSGQANVASSDSRSDYGQVTINLSNASPVYGRSSTVQPPAIKVRFFTRYE